MKFNNSLSVSNHAEPIILFIRLLLLYILLFSVASILQSGLFKLIVNITAIGVFLILLVNWAFLPQKKAQKIRVMVALALFIYYIGLIGSVVLNFNSVDIPDLLKFIMAPMFLVFGMVFEENRRTNLLSSLNNKILFFLLMGVPLVFWGVQLVFGMTAYGSGQDVAFFPNRNTAALYAVTLIALYNVLAVNPVQNIWIYMIVAFLFGSLGVLFAVLLSLIFTVVNKKTWKYLVFFFCGIVGFYLIFHDIGIFARLNAVFSSLGLVLDGSVDLYNVSYGDIVRKLNSTDLSFIFRLKHWLELFYVYLNGGISELLFGFGVGSTVGMTVSNLIPHNDYLRLLLEMGGVTLLGFLSLMILIVSATWRRWEAVPLLAVILYFFSENLINSYASMMIFYFSAGVMIYRIQVEKEVVDV